MPFETLDIAVQAFEYANPKHTVLRACEYEGYYILQASETPDAPDPADNLIAIHKADGKMSFFTVNAGNIEEFGAVWERDGKDYYKRDEEDA